MGSQQDRKTMNLKDTLGNFAKEYLFEGGGDGEEATSASAQAAPARTATPTTAPRPTATVPVSVTPITTPVAVPASGADENFVQKLRVKMAASPSSATIQAFTASLDSLAEFIPEEGQRFRAAAKQLLASGVNAGSLSDAYSALFGILDTEAQGFTTVVQQRTADQITARESQIETINASILDKQNEITGLMQQRDSISNEILQQKTKIATIQAGFEGAVRLLRSEVEDIVRKLKIYVAPPTTQGSK
jgi:hypothetical protein